MRRKAVAFALICILHFIGNTASMNQAQVRLLPDKLACPVTSNVFPQVIRSGQLIRYIFLGNEVVRRISISILTPDGMTIEIGFRWIGDLRNYRAFLEDWGSRFGSFLVEADGAPKCFFLGQDAKIPDSVALYELDLLVPEGRDIREVRFSTVPSEIPSIECPMPRLEEEIREAFMKVRSDPENMENIEQLIQLLSKTIPRYDCRRDNDDRPVPAWWLVNDDDVNKWLDFVLWQAGKESRAAFILLVGFYATSDGYISEGLSYRLLEFLSDMPLLVLRSWPEIREHGERILHATRFQDGDQNIRMIDIYRKIQSRNSEYKSECAEIIKLLEKWDSIRTAMATDVRIIEGPTAANRS
jgi:hypothetical protein